MLRTSAVLVRRSACEHEERKALMRWITGLRSTTRGQPHRHPALYHVGVWYRADDHDNGVVTHWTMQGGIWSRCSILVNPPRGYDFV